MSRPRKMTPKGEQTWKSQGNCHNSTEALEMLYSVYEEGQEDAAALWCTECPVREECLEYALDAGETFGVWGGQTEVERRILRRSRR